MDPQAAALVRMVFAGLGVIPLVGFQWLRRSRGEGTGHSLALIGSRRAGFVLTLLGGVVGPYLGMWMSLIAVDRTPLGVAQTLCSLTPVLILPFVVFVQKERVSPRAAIGAFIAVAGSAVLFLGPKSTEPTLVPLGKVDVNITSSILGRDGYAINYDRDCPSY